MLTANAVVWVFTALGGLTMLAIWLANGGHRQREVTYEPDRRGVPVAERRAEARAHGGESHISTGLIGAHAAMGLIGVAIAIAYAVNGSEDAWEPAPWFLLAWAIGLAFLGVKMVFFGSGDRDRAAEESPVELAEEHIPKTVLAAHTLGAIGVLVLTFLIGVGVGR